MEQAASRNSQGKIPDGALWMPSIRLLAHACTLSDGLPGPQWPILWERAIPIPGM